MSEKNLKEAGKGLPKNWEVFHSKKTNKLYYYNNITKKTQWQHPSLGEKNHKHDRKSKSKKRNKAQADGPDGHDNMTNKKQEETCKETKLVEITKEKQNTDASKLSAKLPRKTYKELPKINKYPNLKPASKTNAQAATETPKTKPQIGKQKAQCEAVNKTQNESTKQSKKILKLQPLTRRKSIGEGSDSGVSDSSERILAWLADTSRINFKQHPIPQDDKLSEKTGISPARTNKQKTEKQKSVILERVESSTATGISNQKSDNILDKLLPKHAQATSKQRYAPYKLTKRHDKPESSNQQEKEKDIFRPTAPKTNIPKASNTTETNDGRHPINQCGVSSDRANSVAGNFGGKTPLSQNRFLALNPRHETTVDECRNPNVKDNRTVAEVGNVNLTEVDNLPNGLQKSQHFGSTKENQREQQQPEALSQRQSNGLEDEVLSMDEGAGSDGLLFTESEVYDMEVDNVEELTKEIIHELKEMRNSVIVDPNQVPKDPMAMNISCDGYEGTLYIVLDTNVLLSHLKFVMELKDFPIPGIGRPVLVIPWVVIQELDSLKENKWKRHETGDIGKNTKVDLLARNAIKYLNSSFQKSDPRIRGQTVEEASEHVGNLKEETNDDRILQCCLLFHERAQNGSCVLFSNDVNLCNKAIVNGIKAFNYQKLLPGLKDLFQCGAIVAQNLEEYNIQLEMEEEQARRRQKADDILCELQIILREGLSYIIESEMKQAYDDLWLEIVHIKPPWTLIDVLQLLEKHWIAVFGHILRRNRKSLIDKLRQKFDDRKGTASSLQFCSEVLKLSLELFQSFSCHSNYYDAMPKCLAAVNVLVQKCQQYQANMSTSPDKSQTRCLTYPTQPKVTSVEDNNSSINQQSDEVVRGNNGSPHEQVTNTFNLIWTAVTQFSTQIFTALGYPNTITDGPPQDYPKASKDEACSFLSVLCPKLQGLVRSIQNVLRDPWEKASQNDALFIQLEQAITVFLSEVLSQNNYATADKLFEFCKDASMRTSLVQGLSQLDRASAMLQHCASCVAQSSTLPQ